MAKHAAILFKKDWDRYPEAIVDINTKNKSSLVLAKTLKAMGNMNHLFHLALINPRLKNVDPHDPKITKKQIKMVIRECRINPWYFFREVLRAPASSGYKPTEFRLNRANVALIWLFLNELTPFLIQPRQTGKSFSMLGLLVYLAAIGTANSNLNLLTKDNTLRAETMVTFKKLMNALPKYLQLWTKADPQNTEKFGIGMKRNAFRISVARSSVEDADGVGRGLTSPFLFVDEIAYFRNIDVTLPVALSSTGAARDNSRANGLLYGNAFFTTAGKLNTKSGQFAFKKYQDGTPFTESMYDVEDRERLLEIVRINSGSKENHKAPIVVLDYNHLQLGYDDEWLEERLAMTGSTGADAETDYFNKWVYVGADSLLTKEELERIQASLIKPHTELGENGYMLRWYVNLDEIYKLKSEDLVMGIDTSDAAGNDQTTLIIRKASTGEVVAAGAYNETNLIKLADHFLTLLERFPKMTMIIERKSSAVTMLDYMMPIMHYKGIDPLKRIFNNIIDDMNAKSKPYDEFNIPLMNRDITIYDKYKKTFGFTTTGTGKFARDALYGNILQNAVRYCGDSMKDKQLVSQLAGLVIRNDRLDHKLGGNDDLLFAYLLTQWFLVRAKHKNKYGINELNVLSNIGNNEFKKDKKSQEKDREQKYIQDEIIRILKRLESGKSSTIESGRLLAKLKKLESRLDVTANNASSLNSRINTMKHELKSRTHVNRNILKELVS